MGATAASLIYLGLAAVYMLVVMTDNTRRQTRQWKIIAGAVWIGAFVALAFLADRLGLRLP